MAGGGDFQDPITSPYVICGMSFEKVTVVAIWRKVRGFEGA